MKATIDDLQAIFSRAMGEGILIDINSTREDIMQWDSINQLNLILELEDFYKISFSKDEIEKIKSVENIIEILDKK